MPAEVKRLRQLEGENAKLKRLVADLSLDRATLQDVLSRKPLSLPAGVTLWMTSGSPRRCRSVRHAKR